LQFRAPFCGVFERRNSFGNNFEEGFGGKFRNVGRLAITAFHNHNSQAPDIYLRSILRALNYLCWRRGEENRFSKREKKKASKQRIQKKKKPGAIQYGVLGRKK
jgi:hypothetical protein